MKSKVFYFIALLALALFLLPASSYAASPKSLFGGEIMPAKHKTAGGILAANKEISLSYSYNSQYYAENIGDNESGGISGVRLSVSDLGNFFSIPLAYEYLGYSNSSGSFSYTDGVDGVNANDDTNILTVSARFGKAFFLNYKTALIPYVAYNYRKWDRNIQNGYADGTEYLGYQEIYSYDALGLGVLGEYSPVNPLVLKLRLQYSRMLSNSLTTHDLQGYPSMNFSLGNRPVYTLAASADYDVYGPIHAIFGIKYLRTFFGRSNTNSLGFYEPSSATENVTYSLGLAYSF